MNRSVRWRALLAAAPLLAGAAACQGGGDGKAAAPKEVSVYEKPLVQQFSAALLATSKSGSSRFVSSLEYTTHSGKAVDTTSGSQDFAHRTAQADRTVKVPHAFPAKDAELIGASTRETFAVDGQDVLYRTRNDGWLRYRSSAAHTFSEASADVFAHAGKSAPYGGTLADVVRYTIPRHQPQRLDGGARRYREDIAPALAVSLLPASMSTLVPGAAGTVTVTADFDARGRLTHASADLAPFLKVLHRDHRLSKVTSLRAEYTLSRLGEKVPYTIASGKHVAIADKVLADVQSLKRGRCATNDTGLDDSMLVRPVDCGDRHDLRVFGQVSVHKSSKTTLTHDDGFALARQQCDQKFQSAPTAWTREARPRGTYDVAGSATVSSGEGTSIDGDYTCYLTS
ncbi:hypothetical protein [Streptomyces sp. NBC_01465]|uniref:hypothetical protein n=1 Tax=Streptomyces sp. NBC_01465 TaxID=2903878 RepID=UPI002E375937|nr:hypothetical protein [Streptomyces sp. NBC_01465]